MVAILSHQRERAGGAAAAAALTLALGALLVAGLAVRTRIEAGEGGMTLFRVAPDPPPPTPIIRAPQRDTRAAGEAAPPNLTSRGAEVVAPDPVVPLPLPPSLPVSDKTAEGREATSGAADIVGPGSGAGGQGDGFGAGGDGDGMGAGDPDATSPRWTRGRIRHADYPDDLADAGVGGRVTVLYRVETNGRVGACEVTGSSGVVRLDALTCRLIRERFRFRPSRNGAGQPVPAWIRESHEWVFEGLPPAE